jgi:hypothetical protein
VPQTIYTAAITSTKTSMDPGNLTLIARLPRMVVMVRAQSLVSSLFHFETRSLPGVDTPVQPDHIVAAEAERILGSRAAQGAGPAIRNRGLNFSREAIEIFRDFVNSCGKIRAGNDLRG